MATMYEALQILPIGQRRGVRFSEGRDGHVYVRRLSTEYQVVAAWPLPAIHGEDPESIICGCALQGPPHAHAEMNTTDASVAASTYEDAKEAVRAHQIPAFAASHRIGG